MTVSRRDLIACSVGAAFLPMASRVLGAAGNSLLPLGRRGFCVDVAPFSGADQTITDYSGFGYCPGVDAMLLFGGGHAATPEDVVLRLPMSTLRWTADYRATATATMLTPTRGAKLDMQSRYPAIKPGDAGWPRYLTVGRFWQVPGQRPPLRPISRHTYSGFVWSQAVKQMILPMTNDAVCYGFPNSTVGGNIACYDPVSRSWEDTGLSGGPSAAAWCEDPVSGMLIAHFNAGFVVYDPRERKFVRTTQLNAIPNFGYAGNLVYYPPTDRFYYLARQVDAATGCSRVWEYALDRVAWLPRYTRPMADSLNGLPMDTNWHPTPPTTDTRYVFDATNSLIVGGICPGVVCAFRPLGNNVGEWYQQNAPGLERTIFYCHQYAPVLDVHLTLCRVGSGIRTFAFRWDPGKAVRCTSPVGKAMAKPASGAASVSASTRSPSAIKPDGIAADAKQPAGDFVPTSPFIRDHPRFGIGR